MTGIAGVFALLLSVGMLFSRRAAHATWLCAAQAVCAAAALAATGPPIAAVALALNAIAMPMASRHVLGQREISAHRMTAWPIAAAAVAAAVVVTLGVADVAALGIMVTLLGLAQSFRGIPALALLSSQNGLLLVAGAVPDLPLPDVLVAAVPLVPAMLLVDAWLHR